VVLVDFLRANADIFAWHPSNMPSIPREDAEHSLDILPHSRAVQQRLWRFDEERHRAIEVELQKLLEAAFVLVKKNNGKWRMFLFFCHELIRSLIQLRGVSFYVSLMPILGTTK
jgi:hypothetical protein